VSGAEVRTLETSTTTGSCGIFRLQGETRWSTLLVLVAKDGHADYCRWVKLPAGPLRVELPRWSVLRGRILVERPDLLFVRAVDADGSGCSGDLDADGSFALRFAGGATVAVEVWLRRDAAPALRLGPLHLPEGLDRTDVALAAVDLRGRLRTLVLDLQRADGRPARSAAVALLAADGEAGAPYTTCTGQLRVPILRPETDLLVHVPGSRALRLHPVRDHLVVRPPAPALVRLRASAPPLPPGASLSFALEHDEWIDLQPAAGAPLWTFAVEFPGSWQVRATLHWQGNDYKLERTFPVRIADTDLEQRVHVVVAAEDVAPFLMPDEPAGGGR
jgi:hypothetical protein